MQMADHQPCLEPVRTTPRHAHFWPKFLASALIVQQILRTPVFWLAHAARLLRPRAGIPTPPCRQTMLCTTSVDESLWASLVCLGHWSSVVPYQAKEQQFGQQGCKAKAVSPTPCPVVKHSKTKTNYCSQLNAFKKANTILVKANTWSIRTISEPTQWKTGL